MPGVTESAKNIKSPSKRMSGRWNSADKSKKGAWMPILSSEIPWNGWRKEAINGANGKAVSEQWNTVNSLTRNESTG